MVVGAALLLEVVGVRRVAVLALRVEVVLEEQVARRLVSDARRDVRLDHLLPALLRPVARRRTVDPRLRLPEHDEALRVRIELRLLHIAHATQDDARRRLLHEVVLVPLERRRVRARWRRRYLRSDARLPRCLPLRHGRAELVDRHAIGAGHLVRRIHVVDEGQRDLVDVGALPRQVAAVLAALSGDDGRPICCAYEASSASLSVTRRRSARR